MFENLEITDINPNGFGVARIDGKVIFIKNAIPGEVVDIRIYKKKRHYFYGQVINYIKKSENRILPSCKHFGECGGCSLQFLDYRKQLFYKEKFVLENIKRIGKIEPGKIFHIMGSPKVFEYRNKLEFTFSNNRWIPRSEIDENKKIVNKNALGFM